MTLTTRLKSILYAVPQDLKRNQREGDLDAVRVSVQQHYCRGWRAKENQPNDEYEKDLVDHVHRRLHHDRSVIVPWLNSVRPLRGAAILEIGCGTGSSSLALAEQGASVTGIDIDDDALVVARDRCKAYGVECEFHSANIAEYNLDRHYDFVIFFACLEHMTISERLVALKHLWASMDAGSLMVVIETPNRLWHTDHHTSTLPFFNWLPDELAFQYAGKSRRLAAYGYNEFTDENMMRFLRWGRGVSFHEFELACGDLKSLNVLSSLVTAMRFQNIGRPTDWMYKYLLRKIYPGIHSGWFDESLDMVIQR